jgi:hypothetical protein
MNKLDDIVQNSIIYLESDPKNLLIIKAQFLNKETLDSLVNKLKKYKPIITVYHLFDKSNKKFDNELDVNRVIILI